MSSPMLADPIRTLHTYPVSDGAVGMILACEERIHEFTKTPVWIKGVGNSIDRFFLGDRNLVSNEALKKAAKRAYDRANIHNPKNAFDVIEISDPYAYQLPMWLEGLGISEEGQGIQSIENKVNPSGGMLAGNPLMIGGLVRAAEAALQLQNKAGAHQVHGARTALAHGVMGPAGQFHSVLVLGLE
ncbi:MAG: hypothetical protein HQK77_14105 [Desulfobacterales bacterium]|nr:hypothetical protein [Desulfobacterales bacterium]